MGIIGFSTAAFTVGSGREVKGPPPTLSAELGYFWVACWDVNFLDRFKGSIEDVDVLKKKEKKALYFFFN